MKTLLRLRNYSECQRIQFLVTNIIFWIAILMGLVFYTALVLLGVSLFKSYKRLRNKNNSNKLDMQSVLSTYK